MKLIDQRNPAHPLEMPFCVRNLRPDQSHFRHPLDQPRSGQSAPVQHYRQHTDKPNGSDPLGIAAYMPPQKSVRPQWMCLPGHHFCINVNRKSLIGFPAHGRSKRKADAIAQEVA